MSGKIIKHKTVGEQIDDEAEWMAGDLHQLADNDDNEGETIVISNPPSGYYRVLNLYAHKVGSTYKLRYQVDDTVIP